MYIAPLKALVRERMEDWKVRFGEKLGKKVKRGRGRREFVKHVVLEAFFVCAISVDSCWFSLKCRDFSKQNTD